MRVLVTGAGGQVGARVVAHLDREHDVLGAGHGDLDTGDREQVEQVVGSFAPDVVLDCAAVTNVDLCETDPALAYRVNALGPRHLAVAAARVGAHVVTVSTDYVFDGAQRAPYTEWDLTHPISVYGRSKLGGEQEVAAHAPSWAVVRTAWVFGRPGGDFVSWVLGLPDGAVQPVVDDQIGGPTYAGDLVPVLVRIGLERHQGTFHVTNAGECTRFGMARDILELAGRDASILKTTSTAELGRPAPRPPYSVMAGHAIADLGVAPLRHYRDALADYIPSLLSGSQQS